MYVHMRERLEINVDESLAVWGATASFKMQF